MDNSSEKESESLDSDLEDLEEESKKEKEFIGINEYNN
jgi:hypothetical protein